MGKCGVNDKREHPRCREVKNIWILRRQNYELEAMGLSLKNGPRVRRWEFETCSTLLL